MLQRPAEPANYTSTDYATDLTELGLRQSVGRTGICHDDSLAELANGAIKVEPVNREEYPTCDHATKEVW